MNPNLPPIFEDRKLKPGIYKIQGIYTENYIDIELHSRELCCRPADNLGEGRGLWKIERFGVGYTVQRFSPGEPDQFCFPLNGIEVATALCVGVYPVAWRVEIVDDDNHRGFGYVCFCWGTKKLAWDLLGGHKDNGAKVGIHHATPGNPNQTWRLVPFEVELPDQGPPPDQRGLGQPPNYVQPAELERDEFGTIVNEVTVVTTTTHRRYRVDEV